MPNKEYFVKKLNVYYDTDNEVNSELDSAIEKAIKPFGYNWYASGCETGTGKRDLAFDKE